METFFYHTEASFSQLYTKENSFHFYCALGYTLEICHEKHLNITFNDELEDFIKFFKSYANIIIHCLLNLNYNKTKSQPS